MKIAPAALAALLTASPAIGQAPPPEVDIAADKMISVLLPVKDKLTITSPAFADGADMPVDNTQYGKNLFPGLGWSNGPLGTQSYVIVMQDEDAIRNNDAILHWTIYNIPARVTALAPGMTIPPDGASYGPNIGGLSQPWRGPRPPAGAKHRYLIQIFALDTTIAADPRMTFLALKAAMQGHVLASGQMVGLGSFFPGATVAPPAPAPN